MELGKEPNESKETWRMAEKEQPVRANDHLRVGVTTDAFSDHCIIRSL